jgi:hypothetical protein
MSQVLQKILEPKIRNVLRGFGNEEYTGPPTPGAAQNKFVRDLSVAISSAVQEYLTTSVTVEPGQITTGGPASQVTTTPGLLNAL